MARSKQTDIIDKLLDTIDKRLELPGFFVSQECTYYGVKAIAARLGCSVRTVRRLMTNGKLMFYYIYLGKRRTVRTNETMIRMTFHTWHLASLEHWRESHTNPESAIREGVAVLPDDIQRIE